jgi:hypothetical protein
VEVLPEEDGATTTQFLWRARAWFRRHGIRLRRILSACYERLVKPVSSVLPAPLGGPIE